MTRTTYYTASSLDGFIATPDHSLDWLLSRQIDHNGVMGFTGFLAGVGAMAMGATTYEWIVNHDDGWAYAVPAWVFTHRQLTGIEGADITFTQDDVTAVHAAMAEAAGDRDVWIVVGGDLAGQFADVGLLDEVVISYAHGSQLSLGTGSRLDAMMSR